MGHCLIKDVGVEAPGAEISHANLPATSTARVHREHIDALCSQPPLLKLVAKPSLREGTPVLSNPGLSALAELYLFTQKHPVDGAREVRASPHRPQ